MFQTQRIQCQEMLRFCGRTSADIVCGVLDLLSQSKRSAALKAHCCHAHAQHESAALRRWHPLSERMRDGPPSQGLKIPARHCLPEGCVIKRYPSYRHSHRYRYRSGWDSASVSHLVCVQARVKGLYLYLYLSSVTVIACKCDRERIE